MRSRSRKTFTSGLILSAVCVGTSAEAAGPYTPTQALHSMYDQIRTLLGYDPATNASARTTWLGLSYIGDSATSGDKQKINDLANTCPELSPMTNFTSLERLDSVYERVIRGMVGPKRPETEQVKAAKAMLQVPGTATATPAYATYMEYQSKYNQVLLDYLKATMDGDRATAQQKIQTIDEQWTTLGNKIEVDGALFQIKTQQSAFSDAANNHRWNILVRARMAGWAATETAGAFRAPVSEVSPPVQNWPDADGWVKVSFSDETNTMTYTASNASTKGFGGLSLGFVNVVGTIGGGNGEQHKVTQMDALSYSFEVKLVTIRRPWLDSEVFTAPRAWTWQQKPGTQVYPRVSDGPNPEDQPVVPAAFTYDNASVSCPIIPTAMIIARNRTLTATTSKSNYDEVNRSGSNSVGGAFMGIFGGGRTKTWSTTQISSSGNNVTFKVEAPGIGIIGFISDKLKRVPDPNLTDTWPDNAMKPQ